MELNTVNRTTQRADASSQPSRLAGTLTKLETASNGAQFGVLRPADGAGELTFDARELDGWKKVDVGDAVTYLTRVDEHGVVVEDVRAKDAKAPADVLKGIQLLDKLSDQTQKWADTPCDRYETIDPWWRSPYKVVSRDFMAKWIENGETRQVARDIETARKLLVPTFGASAQDGLDEIRGTFAELESRDWMKPYSREEREWYPGPDTRYTEARSYSHDLAQQLGELCDHFKTVLDPTFRTSRPNSMP